MSNETLGSAVLVRSTGSNASAPERTVADPPTSHEWRAMKRYMEEMANKIGEVRRDVTLTPETRTFLRILKSASHYLQAARSAAATIEHELAFREAHPRATDTESRLRTYSSALLTMPARVGKEKATRKPRRR